jgi:hypothetical protein
LTRALDAIAADRPARARYLDFMHAADEAPLQVRMIDLAQHLGWLSADEKRAELEELLASRFERPVITAADVDFVCTLNADRALDGVLARVPVAADDIGHAAILACLGGADNRARLLDALTSTRDADVQIAQVYLRYRPIADVAELRGITSGITQMGDAGAQVRALDTLADHRVSDPEALEDLAQLFPTAKSIGVQRAIAGVLIRSDYQAMATPELVRTLREHRFKSPDGRDLIDVLINRLQSAS